LFWLFKQRDLRKIGPNLLAMCKDIIFFVENVSVIKVAKALETQDQV